MAGQVAAEVIRGHRSRMPLVWIEHYLPESTNPQTETFDLVIFSSYEVAEGSPYLGESRWSVGQLSWKRISRNMVEVSVGEHVLMEERPRTSGRVHGSRAHTTCVPGSPTKSTGVPNKRRRPRGLVARLKFPQIS
jgi:hypothetical protein